LPWKPIILARAKTLVGDDPWRALFVTKDFTMSVQFAKTFLGKGFPFRVKSAKSQV